MTIITFNKLNVKGKSLTCLHLSDQLPSVIEVNLPELAG